VNVVVGEDVDNQVSVGTLEIGNVVSHNNNVMIITSLELIEPFSVKLFNCTENKESSLGYRAMVTPLYAELRVNYKNIKAE